MLIFKKLVKRPNEKVFNRLLDLAEKKDFEVYDISLPKGIDGLYCSLGEKRQVILLDKVKVGNSLNFVFAHELGHATLHKDKTNTALYFKDKGHNRRAEREADRFAGKLLKLLNRRYFYGN